MTHTRKTRFPSSGKVTRFSLAIACILAATALAATHPQWGKIVNSCILLLAGIVAAGVLVIRLRSQDYIPERKGASQKLSTGLVTLSSAAILAIYVAGYQRTAPAANRFSEQESRRGTEGPLTPDVAPDIEPAAGPAPAEAAPPDKVTAARKPPAAPKRTPSVTTRMEPGRVPSSSQPGSNPSGPAADGSNGAIAFVPPPPAAPPPAAPASAIAAIAPPAELAPPPVPAPPRVAGRYKDGTYLGWGSSRHGDIQASVVIQGGQIISTTIAQCLTRYSCSWIDALPGQIVARQGPKIDYVSGATQSCDAFHDAIVQALSKARE